MLQIIDYSEKAIAVIGDIGDNYEQLKAIGGKYNSRLSCGKGFIFSKKWAEKVKAFVNGEQVEQPEQENPRKYMKVYVGTYRKYNEGSIDGAWLCLADYSSKQEFLDACRKLHKDEHDPELMFQDYEGVPSWMIGESFISDEIWHLEPENEDGKRQSKEELRALIEKAGGTMLKWKDSIDHNVKNADIILEIDGRIFYYWKPNIETKFCHPDEPEESVKAWWEVCKTYDYFKNENLEHMHSGLEDLESKEELVMWREDYDGFWHFQKKSNFYWCGEYRLPDGAIAMDDKTRAKLIKAEKKHVNNFVKRLETWWKKYGADHLHVWTYWRDA